MNPDLYYYLLQAACPRCNGMNRIVECTEDPVARDMDVPVETRHCTTCGKRVQDAEWDIHEDHEIEAVEPSA